MLSRLRALSLSMSVSLSLSLSTHLQTKLAFAGQALDKHTARMQVALFSSIAGLATSEQTCKNELARAIEPPLERQLSPGVRLETSDRNHCSIVSQFFRNGTGGKIVDHSQLYDGPVIVLLQFLQ